MGPASGPPSAASTTEAAGTMTLRVYAHRTRPTDRRATDLLAEQLRERGKGRRGA